MAQSSLNRSSRHFEFFPKTDSDSKWRNRQNRNPSAAVGLRLVFELFPLRVHYVYWLVDY